MIGLGILEFGAISLAAIYIYKLMNNKDKLQYIELDAQQFHRLQGTLIANNVIPRRMQIIGVTGPDIIPPGYEESQNNHNQLLTQRENTNNLDSETPPYSDTIALNNVNPNTANTANTANTPNTPNTSNPYRQSSIDNNNNDANNDTNNNANQNDFDSVDIS
jgi:hypothetical protein